MKVKQATPVALGLLKGELEEKKLKLDGLIQMMLYYKHQKDYFKWIFALIVFLLGLMVTWSEAGGENLLP